MSWTKRPDGSYFDATRQLSITRNGLKGSFILHSPSGSVDLGKKAGFGTAEKAFAHQQHADTIRSLLAETTAKMAELHKPAEAPKGYTHVKRQVTRNGKTFEQTFRVKVK